MASDITAITVYYKRKEYIKRYLSTFLSLFPDIAVIVVDNSPRDDECARKLYDMWQEKKIELLVNHGNLGHGKSLYLAMDLIKTKYVLIFDSDVEFINTNLIKDMMNLMDEEKYGIGYTTWAWPNGGSAAPYYTHLPRPSGAIKYLHPVCALLSVKTYYKFPPFEYSKYEGGAPMIAAMRKINELGLEDNLLTHLPRSGYTRCKYWNHLSGGTRILINQERK